MTKTDHNCCPRSRADHRAECDALIAQLYDLTLDEFAYILSTFPLVPDDTKNLTLATFRHLLAHHSLPLP